VDSWSFNALGELPMKVVRDDLWLCQDCTIYAANGDLSGVIDEKTEKAVIKGVDRLGSHLVIDSGEDGEGEKGFSWSHCDACGSKLGGSRTRFAVLG
jgi:hypothetical protein